ncbi:hypothetical protein [Halapricum desulfuricans]|uniref:hypothetical protein n=1 Tax=Halapricum desulfuricans TaxID=2841257 RepID=UPI001E515E89|nr:hypothetical protein [Halapricum desulfuricans]
MGVVAGPMMGQIEDGFSVLGEMTTSTTLNISDEATFSAAADYVYHRASNDGCRDPDETGKTTVQDRINEGKYDALEDTFLTSQPPCVATDDPQGGDQEGKLSRVEFVIDETSEGITLNTSGQLWIEKNRRIMGVRDAGFYDATREQCSRDVWENGLQAGGHAAVMGAAVSSGNLAVTVASGGVGFFTGAATSAIAGERFVGNKDKYIIYVNDGEASEISDDILDDSTGFGNSIYCYAVTDQLTGFSLSGDDGVQFLASPLKQTYDNEFGGKVDVKLCPGTRGYIQVNKEKPQNDGEAGESIWGWAQKYPFIQITEMGEC